MATVETIGNLNEKAEGFKTEIEDARLAAQQGGNDVLAEYLGNAAAAMDGVLTYLGDAESHA